jgi:hypothetical protein
LFIGKKRLSAAAGFSVEIVSFQLLQEVRMPAESRQNAALVLDVEL